MIGGEPAPSAVKTGAQTSLKYNVPLNTPLQQLPDPYPASEKKEALLRLRNFCVKCRDCRLAESATNLVFGEGNPDAEIVFVGEAPGETEDLLSRPFVGQAGKLLTRSLNEFGVYRPEIYICNVAKHRPPDNRNPEKDEIAACTPHLAEQLKIINPKVIIAMGKFSAQYLLDTEETISKLRGRAQKSRFGFLVFPTFHPAYILRNMTAFPDFTRDLETAFGIANGIPR
ncbi:MAG: hypothetical protein A2Y33_00370 [Spirochaetes bacterium GWF1_51_8]|nr:MAG: hypothetical protein A2Y33_00370 [Spirochaetes bacterium GWF1_51_8]